MYHTSVKLLEVSVTHKKPSERKKSFIYDHANEEHGGIIPAEIIERFTGDAGARQATEAVCIRDEKPK